MRTLDDALKTLSEFESLAGYGLHPSESLKEVTDKDRWDSLGFASLEFRVGQLKVKAVAYNTDIDGHLAAGVWYSGKESYDDCIFEIYADREFLAHTVVDYIKKHEVAA